MSDSSDAVTGAHHIPLRQRSRIAATSHHPVGSLRTPYGRRHLVPCDPRRPPTAPHRPPAARRRHRRPADPGVPRRRHLTFDDGVYGASAVAMRAGGKPFGDVFSSQGPLLLPLRVGRRPRRLPDLERTRVISIVAGVLLVARRLRGRAHGRRPRRRPPRSRGRLGQHRPPLDHRARSPPTAPPSPSPPSRVAARAALAGAR